MHAVARGAAVYGKVRAGHGIRIRGGVPRTYYVGIESSMPAVPGFSPPLRALTVAPFGMEEGTGAKVPAGEFSLVIGEPAEFRFFSSSSRRNDELGAMVDDYGDELDELSPIQVCLPADDAAGQPRPRHTGDECDRDGRTGIVVRRAGRAALEARVSGARGTSAAG